MAIAFESVPIIDVGPLFNPSATPEQRLSVAKEICKACEEVGFLQVINHNVDLDYYVPRVLKFFDAPLDVKMSLARKFWTPTNHNMYRGYFPTQEGATSWKEGIDIGPEGTDFGITEPNNILVEPNVWPPESALPNWKRDVCELYSQFMALGMALMRAIAVGLDLSANHFDRLFDKSISTLRLLHYPPIQTCQTHKTPETLSCSEHTDSGILTLLWQDATGGLEAKNSEGKWIPVKSVAGALVINLGDLLQKWTNDLFVATVHRVVPVSTNGGRHSIPFFFEPNFDAQLEPLHGRCVTPAKPAKYASVIYGKFMLQKILQFAEYSYLKQH